MKISTQKRKHLDYLTTLLPKDGSWFISGSFANEDIENPKDIDVYFRSEEAYIAASHTFAQEKYWELVDSTEYATTWYFGGSKKDSVIEWFGSKIVRETKDYLALPIQLIQRTFGTPKEIFTAFDIELCKKAILPDGTTIDGTSIGIDPYHLSNINAETYKRLIKYVNRNKDKIDPYLVYKKVIDEQLENNTVLEDYYGDITNNKAEDLPNNKILFHTFLNEPCVREYLLKQTRQRAPELLI